MITEEVLSFSQEKVKDIWGEIIPLLTQHWEELEKYDGVPLEPDRNKYEFMDTVGAIRVYTAREEGKLIGYCVFFINKNLHSKNVIQALQDVLFVRSDRRGFGLKFIKWCDEQLKKEGVAVIHRMLKKAHDFGSLLERIGYEQVDLIYARRLI